MAAISNRLTRTLRIEHPVISAPMAFAAGGALAAAVSAAGGLGLIGGGYGDSAWLDEQFKIAAGRRVGVGFITWSLQRSPHLLTQVLKYKPAAVMLSFGDPRPFVEEIRRAGALVMCQCQNRSHIRDAIEVGADIVVAQGAEAGGHGALRGTLSLVPEAADLLAAHSPNSLLRHDKLMASRKASAKAKVRRRACHRAPMSVGQARRRKRLCAYHLPARMDARSRAKSGEHMSANFSQIQLSGLTPIEHNGG